MEKLILIDGNAIVHRAYHALPPFRDTSGELVNAVFGFSSMLLSLMIKYHPQYLAVSFDIGKSFRHDECDDYKATRKKAPDDLYPQFSKIKEVLEAFQVPVYEKEGFEADDVLGTLAFQAADQGTLALIATSDKDSWQLVNDNIHILMPHKGFKESIIVDSNTIQDKTGLTPQQIRDFKALAGDNSDNIKGVPGIGVKTATQLLQDYQNLEGIYQNLKHLKPAVAKKLTTGKDSAYKSQKLATIITDVDIQLDLNDCVTHEINKNAVEDIFQRFAFRSLVRKLQQFQEHFHEEIQKSSGQQSLF